MLEKAVFVRQSTCTMRLPKSLINESLDWSEKETWVVAFHIYKKLVDNKDVVGKL